MTTRTSSGSPARLLTPGTSRSGSRWPSWSQWPPAGSRTCPILREITNRLLGDSAVIPSCFGIAQSWPISHSRRYKRGAELAKGFLVRQDRPSFLRPVLCGSRARTRASGKTHSYPLCRLARALLWLRQPQISYHLSPRCQHVCRLYRPVRTGAHQVVNVS